MLLLYSQLDHVDVRKFQQLSILKWVGYLLIKDNLEITKNVVNAQFKGKRIRGRQRLSWMDDIKGSVRAF